MPPARMRRDILRQPDHAVAVRALQLGLGHQVCDRCGIGVRQADRGERVLNEGLQAVKVTDVSDRTGTP